LEEAFGAINDLEGVVVASPPAFHVEQSIAALDRGLPVLLEKPVAPEYASAKQLATKVAESNIPLLLGYTWRWWPPLRQIRELVQQQAVGNIHYVRFVMAAHLADWHPWERYQDFFMASRELGGGALLDESHWIDLMLWLFGLPRDVLARIEKISDLEIDSDDNVDMLFAYTDGLRVAIHLDLHSRPHEKYIRLVGSEGTILWTVEPNQVAVSREVAEVWKVTDYDCERNDMFKSVAAEFESVLEGRKPQTCTIEDGLRVMNIIDAARKSHAYGRVVRLGEEAAEP